MNKKSLTRPTIEKIRLILEGKTVPSSLFPSWLAEELKQEGLLYPEVHGSRVSYKTADPAGCRRYLEHTYTAEKKLEDWLKTLLLPETNLSRSLLVKETNDSKLRKHRTFEGFLVNCYEPIEARCSGSSVTLSPATDTAIFIQDPLHFHIPPDVRIVGIENGENFRYIRQQRYLFEGQPTLFVCRYPQSTDLRHWLITLPNPYLHFGDFDLAGIHIYLSEFYPYLADRASFFIPSDIEKRIQTGNGALYDKQYAKYKQLVATDERVQPLIELIHRYRRVYEQEGYIL